MLTPLIFLFSRFTHEALLLEALVICVLCATYAAFWLLKKRKLGVIQAAVPANVVKDYLNVLIVDAENLRNQLFGLLSAAGISVRAPVRNVGTAPAVAANLNPSENAIDPIALEKMAALEAKIAEQTGTIEKYMAEKGRIEKELAAARAAGPTTPGKANEVEVVQLRDKISNLEGKLAEYSVIEDDLANLKRLQQENAQLRAALGGSAASVTSSAAAPAAQAASAISAAVAVMPAQSPAVITPAVSLAEADNSPVQMPETEPAPSINAEPSFEGLVDQVENSLGQTAAPVTAPPTTTAQPSTSQPAAGTIATNAPPGKSDADLVAEFEKMLNS